MNAQSLLVLGALLATSSPASAGMIFKEVSGSTGATNLRTVTETMVEGGRARITTIEGPGNPMLRAGSYMLAPGDEVMYMVDPAQRTYTRFDLEKMRSAMHGMQQPNAATSMRREFANVQLKQQVDEASASLLGLPTRHYKYELSYVETMTVAGAPKPMEKRVREVHEFWSTSALSAAIGAGKLATMSAKGGDDPAGQPLAEAQAKMQSHGFVLKEIVSGDSTMSMPGLSAGMGKMMLGMAGGGNDKYTTTREVTELRQEKIPDAMLALPAGYKEVQMTMP
jgi:hypothetical protein